MPRPKEGFHDVAVQVPEELWNALCAEATTEQRSATGQLIYILRTRYADVAGELKAPPKKPRRKK